MTIESSKPISIMADGSWCLIESDPGVFTELISNMGAKGIRVEEVWSLDDETLSQLKHVYGLVFLFKWQSGGNPTQEHATSDHDNDDGVFFAHQVINNACATQAILSILLNAKDIDLGSELTNFKSFAGDFSPEMRGLAISNSDTIRTVHNSFARYDPFENETPLPATEKDDVFHFITYMPINGTLYELDGLKPNPINLGPCTDADWLQKIRPIIQDRMATYASSEIRFNLMAVTKDPVDLYYQDICELDTKIEAMEKMQAEGPSKELEESIQELQNQKAMLQHELSYEEEKLHRWKKENARRRHNFIPLIYNLLKKLSESSELKGLVENAKANS
ncbi:ubiquitinyl hydrolase [Basidiobolus meristosporus CBS 931.73]|uniref:Ubiquitin carboxyl-terminal hydrolase n=1 Tax=Basidiobolus meristosporus CBS 931.73 TaxID=1314790 RepID=A0A1Y1Z001_9FUNG|nr:ubiquitinyl hydrolase [Basidiobolus meristosporus CBS 931.73]|eukprot:ORY03633.1 ubiquitinyl hydrolase [Basidiobolus meristosporus CBS 931.73]